MPLYNNRKCIGVAAIDYDSEGKPLLSVFKPADYILNTDELHDLLLVPAKSPEEVTAHAQSVVASWFLKQEVIETADREVSRIETKLIHCDKWPSGAPKHCELAFYFATTEPRVLTGVR